MRLSRSLKTLILNYPIPLFAFCGIAIGLFFYFFEGDIEVAHWIWLATLVIGGVPIVGQTLKGMLCGQFAADIVAMLAIITAVAMDQAFAGAIVVLMQSGGEAIERYGLKRASSSLDALIARAPRFARKKRDSTFEEIAVGDVQIGDILLVRRGDLIPVDGKIVSGEAEIDESALTGEPLAKSKKSEDLVLSGSINLEGAFEMRAEKLSRESQYSKIVELVRKAQSEKAPIQRLADRYAVIFTPLTLFMAMLGYWITKDPTVVLSVLVVATPCPLILATPIAVMSGINRAAREGIIVKGGAPIEQIGKAEAVVFDKTGTVTYGSPFLEKIISCGEIPEEKLLFMAASIEQLSSHLVAQAFVIAAKKFFDQLSLPDHFREIPGRGIEAELEGKKIAIGSYALMRQVIGQNFLKDRESLYEKIQQEGKLIAFMSENHHCIALFVFSDKIRPKVVETIDMLRSLGVKEVDLLTGDCIANAELIAKQASFDHIEADLLPIKKVEFLQSLKKKYRTTVMVGDGINDAPALATATVGVAMGAHGSGISADAADLVLLEDDLFKVASAVAIGQRMLYIAKQSIFVGLGCSFLLMLIAIFGLIAPPVGALLQEIIDVAVVLNALRAR